MPDRRAPRVVAELGRPETPQETADRKAEQSKNYRKRKTVNNLVLSLLVTLGIVLVIVLGVPRDDSPRHVDVDYLAVQADAQRTVEQDLVAPALPDDWRSNFAEVRGAGAGGVASWNIGLLTPSNGFIGIAQGLEANQTWVAATLNDTAATGTTSIGGVDWTVYDNRDRAGDVGNAEYGLVAEGDGSTVVVFGTATDAEFELVAERIAQELPAPGGAADTEGEE